jgi:hypothetical protein
MNFPHMNIFKKEIFHTDISSVNHVKSDKNQPAPSALSATTYTYRLRTTLDTRTSAYSVEVSTTTPEEPLQIPMGLTGVAFHWNYINLAWTSVSPAEATFELERKVGDSSYEKIADINAGVLMYADIGLNESTQYSYRLRSKYNGTTSAEGEEVSVTTPAKPLSPPSVPANLKVSDSTLDSLAISWDEVPGSAVTYDIGISPDGFDFSTITSASGVLSHVFSGLDSDTTYYYRVRARNAIGMSAYTEVQAGSTLPGPVQPPARPPALAARPVAQTVVSIVWAASATPDASYELERKNDAGVFEKIADIPAGVLTYTDSNRAPATSYTYRLRAVGNGLYSDYAAGATAITPGTDSPATLPAAPRYFSMGPLSPGEFRLTWPAPASSAVPVVEYRVYMNGALLGVTTQPEFSFWVKSTDPLYGRFSIKSVDASGNESDGIESSYPFSLCSYFGGVYYAALQKVEVSASKAASAFSTGATAPRRYFLTRDEHYRRTANENTQITGQSNTTIASQSTLERTSRISHIYDPAKATYSKTPVALSGKYTYQEARSSSYGPFSVSITAADQGNGFFFGKKITNGSMTDNYSSYTPGDENYWLMQFPWSHFGETITAYDAATLTTQAVSRSGSQTSTADNRQTVTYQSTSGAITLSDEYTDGMFETDMLTRLNQAEYGQAPQLETIAERTRSSESARYSRSRLRLRAPPSGLYRYRYRWVETFTPGDGGPVEILGSYDHILFPGDAPMIREYPLPEREGKISIHWFPPDDIILTDSNGDGVLADVVSPDQPLYLWVNDDDDHAPGQKRYPANDTTMAADELAVPDHADDKINGVNDQKDFFPIQIAFQQKLVKFTDANAMNKVRVVLKQADAALKYTCTTLSSKDAISGREKNWPTGFGPALIEPSSTASLQTISAGGVELPRAFVEQMRNSDKGVIWVEAVKPTAKPLQVELWYDGQLQYHANIPLGTIELVLDSQGVSPAQDGARGIKQARFGLWDKAFGPGPDYLVRNGAAEADNFIGSDRRRFYIKVHGPRLDGAALPGSIQVDWFTTKPDGSDDDHPANGLLTLEQTAPGSNAYISKAVMLVTDETDAKQETNDGHGNMVQRNQPNHRLRKADVEGRLHVRVMDSTNSIPDKTHFSVPVFKKHEMRKLHINVVRYSPDELFVATSLVDKHVKNAQERWAVAGLKLTYSFIYDLRPIPNLKFTGFYKINEVKYRMELFQDIAAITADKTLTLVFLNLENANGFAEIPALVSMNSIYRPSFDVEAIAGDRSIIILDPSTRPEYGTLAHELFHILFNRWDKEVPRELIESELIERQYFPFNTHGNYKNISDSDVRARRRIQYRLLEPKNWVHIVRTTKEPIPKAVDEIDYTVGSATGNVLVEKY